MEKSKLLNGTTLAFIGDAYYDLMIRKYLVSKGYTKSKDLHDFTTKYVSASAQAKILNILEADNFLLEEELDIVKRGRNAKINHGRQNVDILTYKHSTAFEALIGYLYLLNYHERLNIIINKSISIIESRNYYE